MWIFFFKKKKKKKIFWFRLFLQNMDQDNQVHIMFQIKFDKSKKRNMWCHVIEYFK